MTNDRPRVPQPTGQRLPVGRAQENTKMRDGDLVAIDRIGDAWRGRRGKVGHELMPEQVEVHPMFC